MPTESGKSPPNYGSAEEGARTSSTSSSAKAAKFQELHGTLARTLIAVFVVAGVAVTWSLSAQFSKTALNIDPKHFFAPYALTWFSTAFTLLCYPAYLLYAVVFQRKTLESSRLEAERVFSIHGFQWKPMFTRVTPFLAVWMAANYAYARSLGHISTSAASSIMSTNTAMVWGLGWLWLGEPFSFLKLLSAVVAIAAVVVISLDSEFAGSWLGVALVLASAATAALYKVAFKRVNGNATLGQVSAFLTALGTVNCTLNLIPTVVLICVDADHIEWAYVPWAPFVGHALLALLFNFLVNFGIALLDPLVISIGMLCGIPLNAAIDVLFRDMHATFAFWIAGGLFVVAFVLSTFPLAEWWNEWRQRRLERVNAAVAAAK